MAKIRRRSVVSIISVVMVLLFTASTVSSDDSVARKQALFKALANAANEADGRAAEREIWEFWFSQSPTRDVRVWLDAGIERREAYDYEAAETHLDKVIELAPNYAEGYNQRGFIRFLRQNYAESQADLEIALELEPNHFGALAGMYQIHSIQSRQAAAMSMLQNAVEIHPWIRERHALPKDMWPESYRKLQTPKQEI